MIDDHLFKFPFGEIEQISEVGLVQKIEKQYAKYSIDRLVGYTPRDDVDEKLILCELKARVAPNTAQHDHKRVLQYHRGEKYVSTHSIPPASWYFIRDPKEHLQVLHHCYIYEKTPLLYITGDTQGILSGDIINIDL